MVFSKETNLAEGTKKGKMTSKPQNDHPVELHNWLSHIPDKINISKISLPGTHNSAACYTSFPSVRCQDVGILDQLNHGVRFLDIRVSTPYMSSFKSNGFNYRYKKLQVIHGNFPVRLLFPVKLDTVLNEIYQFLDNNKSEVVIVSVKPEGPHSLSEQQFSDIIWEEYLYPATEKWYFENRIPSIGQVRGKAILFRRFAILGNKPFANTETDTPTMGIDAAVWKYNSISHETGFIAIQDWCEVISPTDIEKKSTYIKNHLKRAIDYNSTTISDQVPKLFLNFYSGSNFWNYKCWPRNISRVIKNLPQVLDKSCGIVVMDFANADDWQVIRTIVDLNL